MTPTHTPIPYGGGVWGPARVKGAHRRTNGLSYSPDFSRFIRLKACCENKAPISALTPPARNDREFGRCV